MMTVEQMVAEMTRKPDAQLLAGWTADVLAAEEWASQVCADIDTVTAAYFDALEG